MFIVFLKLEKTHYESREGARAIERLEIEVNSARQKLEQVKVENTFVDLRWLELKSQLSTLEK